MATKVTSQHTPEPWQRSRFVDSPAYQLMSEEWKAARRREEAQIIRGPGVIGTPGCNVVARVECPNPADFTLMIAAPELLAALTDLVWWTEGRSMGYVACRLCGKEYYAEGGEPERHSKHGCPVPAARAAIRRATDGAA